MSGKESNWGGDYVKRRMIYAAGVLVVAVATGFGLINEDQASSAESWLPTIVAGIVGIGTGGLAWANTNRGSDSTATGEDVRAAQHAMPDIPNLVDQFGPVIRQQVQEAVSGVYSAPYGRHEADGTTDDVEVPVVPDTTTTGGYPG